MAPFASAELPSEPSNEVSDLLVHMFDFTDLSDRYQFRRFELSSWMWDYDDRQ